MAVRIDPERRQSIIAGLAEAVIDAINGDEETETSILGHDTTGDTTGVVVQWPYGGKPSEVTTRPFDEVFREVVENSYDAIVEGLNDWFDEAEAGNEPYEPE